MKTLFEIIPESIDATKCSLVCELTSEDFSYAVKNNDNNQIVSLGVYQYDSARPKSGFHIALQILFHRHAVLSERFSRSCFVHTGPVSVLVPFTMYNSKKSSEILSLVHGDMNVENATILTDKLPALDLYNIYALPAEVHETVFHQFPAIRPLHLYSVFLRETLREENRIKIIFYNNKMIVALWKERICQLVNTYYFRVPEDVSYILLNIAKQWEMPDVPVEIGGFVEESSLLFKSVFKYFTSVTLSAPPKEYQLGEYLSQFPAHFFNHIYAFDLCE